MRKTNDTFGTYNPLINFTFFIGAIILGMFYVHPLFVFASIFCSCAYYLSIRRAKGIKRVILMLLLLAVLSAINPLFNTAGSTILFTVFNRPFTLEALLYGASLSGMFISVMMWFACYNEIMTSDKFTHMFGRMIPALSLILTMILRLIPGFEVRMKVIAGARKCIGKAPQGTTKKRDIQNGLTIISILTSWALEGAVVTADSMKSRGYGLSGRTSFSLYRYDSRDKALLVFLLALSAVTICCSVTSDLSVIFIPEMVVPPPSLYSLAALLSYFVFMLIPTIINVTEEIKWHILRSRI